MEQVSQIFDESGSPLLHNGEHLYYHSGVDRVGVLRKKTGGQALFTAVDGYNVAHGQKQTTNTQQTESIKEVSPPSEPSLEGPETKKKKDFWTTTVTADIMIGDEKFSKPQDALLEVVLSDNIQQRLNDKKTFKKKVWKKVADTLSEAGVVFPSDVDPGEYCDQKWRNLTSSFRTFIQKKTGEGAKRKPEYFDKMYEVLGPRQINDPKFLIDTLAKDFPPKFIKGTAKRVQDDSASSRSSASPPHDGGPDAVALTTEEEERVDDPGSSSTAVQCNVKKSVKPVKEKVSAGSVLEFMKDNSKKQLEIEEKKLELANKFLQQESDFQQALLAKL